MEDDDVIVFFRAVDMLSIEKAKKRYFCKTSTDYTDYQESYIDHYLQVFMVYFFPLHLSKQTSVLHFMIIIL